MFVPGQFGTFPEEHSQSGIRPYLGNGLPDVEAYDDLFLQREAMHPWLLDTRACDALNTHDLRIHGGHPTLAHETLMGRREDQRKQQQTTKWYVHAYLHADDPDTLPLGEDVLEGIQFGGKRNYGSGEVKPKDTQIVDDEAVGFPLPTIEAAGGVIASTVGDQRVVVVATDDGLHAFEYPGFDLVLDTDGRLVGDETVWTPATGESDDGRRLDRLPARRLFAFAWQDDHGPDAFYTLNQPSSRCLTASVDLTQGPSTE